MRRCARACNLGHRIEALRHFIRLVHHFWGQKTRSAAQAKSYTLQNPKLLIDFYIGKTNLINYLNTQVPQMILSKSNKDKGYHVNQTKVAQQEASFFQLAGHQGCFKIGMNPRTILKKSSDNEEACFRELIDDKLAPFVPKVFGVIKLEDGDNYLEMEDLLSNFGNDNLKTVCVMDVKMGLKTCREDEGFCPKTRQHKLRPEMYRKMIEVDPGSLTDEESKIKMVTKQRYMNWRDNITSSASLGFRIEGIRYQNGSIDRSFQRTKTEEEISIAFRRFASNLSIRAKYLKRLFELRNALLQSKFFFSHEIIGSSLLFIHNDKDANIWMIDFAKANSLPNNIQVTHRSKRENSNYEDGYLVGIDNMIRLFESIITSERNFIGRYLVKLRQLVPCRMDK